jgi:hypothetical protein
MLGQLLVIISYEFGLAHISLMKNHEYRYFMLVFELGWLMLVQVEIALMQNH